MSLWSRIVEANRPGPPEHSLSFRIASVGAVVIGVGACWSQGELTTGVSVIAVVATVVGNVLSYLTRTRPWPGVKPALAVCAIGGFAWFLTTVTHRANAGDVSTVEGPLAVLFAWILSTHAFDVPARRDVTYSLAGSTALVAVAAAQSVDLTLGLWIVAWVACGIWGLIARWQSMAGVHGVPWRSLAISAAVIVVVAVGLLVVLPAPQVSTALIFPSASPDSSSVTAASGLTDGSAALPAHAAPANGATRVGGYLGFAHSLDTGTRATLSNQIVMRVRTSRPGYWVGQTYDHWDGQSWSQSGGAGVSEASTRIGGGSPFSIPTFPDQLAPRASGTTVIQTFYLSQGGPNLIFHADNAQRVYVQARSLLVNPSGTIISATTMGAGTIYTVVSSDTRATDAELASANTSSSGAFPGLNAAQQTHYTELPHPYPRVATLARSITRNSGGTTVAKVGAIEGWMADHVRYTTDIPPLAPGSDAVDSFLFGSRRGYCEQISTATVVMLRSLGIPAREAVGYVPGDYNPVTDLYDVRANDAHAWVQVWYPGFGWQNVDPTANVPLANPSPGAVLIRDIGRWLSRLPWLPISLVVALGGAVAVEVGRRRRRPATWVERIAADLAKGGSRIGARRDPSETLVAYGQRLDRLLADGARIESAMSPGAIESACRRIERSVYGGEEPTAEQITRATATARQFRTWANRERRRRWGRPHRSASREAGHRSDGDNSLSADQDGDWAKASSNEAPAASNGR